MVNKMVIFDGSGSSDNVGIANYTWIISKNGKQIAVLYGRKPSFRFEEEGEYEVTLSVKDTTGNIGEDMISVNVEPVESDLCWLFILIVVIIGIIIFYFIWKKYLGKEPVEGNGEIDTSDELLHTDSNQSDEGESVINEEDAENTSGDQTANEIDE